MTAASFVGVVVTGGVARAHSGLAAASPGPGAVVGGGIDSIRLIYAEAITGVDGSVTGPDGQPVAAEFVLDSSIEVTIELAAPLDIEGEYAVRHTVDSVDGDVVAAAYLFSYDANAPPPSVVFLEEGEAEALEQGGDGGVAWWAWMLFAAGALFIVVLAVRLLMSIRRARRPRETS